MAPVPWPLRWERGLQVPAAPTQPQRTVFLGEAKPPATITVGKESQAPSRAPSPTGQSNFAMEFAQLREDYQKVQKRPNTSPEQSSQQTRRRKSTESGDSMDSEISKETEMLEPKKAWANSLWTILGGRRSTANCEDSPPWGLCGHWPTPTRGLCQGCHPQMPSLWMPWTRSYRGHGGHQTQTGWHCGWSLPSSASTRRRAFHQNEMPGRGPESPRTEEVGRGKPKNRRSGKRRPGSGNWIKRKERRKRPRDGQPSRKLRNTTDRRRGQRNRMPAWKDAPSWKILSRKVSPRFHQSPRKLPSAHKPSHRSEGRSSGQFGQPPHCMVFDGLLDLKKFPYNCLHKNPGAMIAWVEMSIDLGSLTHEVNSLKYFRQYPEKTREILGVIKHCLILGIDGYRNVITNWPSWLTDTSCPIPAYTPFPKKPEYAKDIRTKARQHWEYYLSWMQHWHDASDVPLSIYYGGCCQLDSQLVVMIAYLINHVLDEPVELKRIRSNMGWVLCRPHLDYGQFLVEKDRECQDALTEETWRIKNWQWCAEQAKDTFAQLKESVLDAIEQYKKKQEAEWLRKKEEDEKYRRDIWHQ